MNVTNTDDGRVARKAITYYTVAVGEHVLRLSVTAAGAIYATYVQGAPKIPAYFEALEISL